MKRVYLKMYAKQNLGDDLFLKVISDRYKNVKFIMYSGNRYNKKINSNLKIYSGLFYKILNKTIKILTNNKKSFEKMLVNKSDIVVEIGGSLFVEKQNIKKEDLEKLVKYYKTLNKDYYILGSNFGPYKTNEYKQKYEDVFANAKDVCFREEYSYNLFKNLPTVRLAPDIVFSLTTSQWRKHTKKQVVISVMDISRRYKLKQYKEEYEEKIIEIINKFKSKGYEVVLMSFCKYEGDEHSVKSILNEINNHSNSIRVYNYNGNINKSLEILSECEIIVATRFHAMILGLLLGKVVLPISYSEKTINVLQDINFKGTCLDIRNLNSIKLEDIDFSYKLDIKDVIEKSQKQFLKLDEVLKN